MRLFEFSNINIEELVNENAFTPHSTIHKVNHHGDEYTKGSIWVIAAHKNNDNMRLKTPFEIALPVNTVLSPYSINGLKKEIERSKKRDNSIYMCYPQFDNKDVFSLTSSANREQMVTANKSGAEILKKIDKIAVQGHLPWTTNPEWQSIISRLLLQSGFSAMLFMKDGTIQMCILKPSTAEVTRVMSVSQATSFAGHSPQQAHTTNWSSFKH